MKDYKGKMNEEIKLRLESDSWNFSIAEKVTNVKNVRRERTLFRGYVSSLAAASLFLVLFIYNVYSYINTRTDETYDSSLLYSYSSDNYSANNVETDLIINEVFPMR